MRKKQSTEKRFASMFVSCTSDADRMLGYLHHINSRSGLCMKNQATSPYFT
ncbi:hypothetical protein [Thalassobacillus pellis]|uniref:hypothetical protein n=1 Tax=Thalassobacillus pellis TaxID=748008 RepID=UPI0019604C29|nr:hypothetical protein [Thalassobacillus pellis]MBM7551741.1 hypothetical protein [Thalassobacillus pellis]